MDPSAKRDARRPGVYEVRPVDKPLDTIVRVPGSKSIANRALVCATLADGISVLRNVPTGDDTAAMLDCIALLGAGVSASADGHSDEGSVVSVTGTGGALRPGPMTLSASLAGTTSRFVTALSALGEGRYRVDGHQQLRNRPMAPLHDALVALGVGVEPDDRWGHLPVEVTGVGGPTGFRGDMSDQCTVTMPGDVSSQYITALMLIAPYLPGGLRIVLATPLVSRPYIRITAAVMSSFGLPTVVIDKSTVTVGAGGYTACDYEIEVDASSASYPLAAAAICGGRVHVVDLVATSMQGDAGFVDVLASMGCAVSRSGDGTTIERVGPLRGVSIDMADMSDLVPTLAVVAPFAETATEISGVGFIRAKESDRLGDLARELRSCGVDAIEFADGIRIGPGFGKGAAVDTHHDHRLAMAFGVLGLRLGGMRVDDPGVVSKSWPGFWEMLGSIGISG